MRNFIEQYNLKVIPKIKTSRSLADHFLSLIEIAYGEERIT